MTSSVTLDVAYQRLAATSPLFQRAWDTEIDEWKEDGGVLGTILMANFARLLTHDIDTLSSDELSALFKEFDVLLIEGDQDVSDTIATGFLEAILGQAARGRLDISRIRQFIGPKSTDYCLAWDPETFTGAT